jgi:hypothetical protein
VGYTGGDAKKIPRQILPGDMGDYAREITTTIPAPITAGYKGRFATVRIPPKTTMQSINTINLVII